MKIRRCIPIAALFWLAGCGGDVFSGPPGEESLQLGAADVNLCLPLPKGSDYIIGDVVAHNSGSGTISFVAVELQNPQGVELVESWFLPTAPEVDLVGVSAASDYEVPAGMSKIDVGVAELGFEEELNLVLRVSDTGEPGGSFDAATVSFRVDGGPTGSTDTFTSVEITKKVDACIERA